MKCWIKSKCSSFLTSCSVIFLIALLAVPTSARADMSSVNPSCPDASVFKNIFNQICWDCFLDSVKIFGIGKKPDGASSKLSSPQCTCFDALGVPEFGWPAGFWAPQKVNEVVTTPWCSPSIGGKRLQESFVGLGFNGSSQTERPSAFYQYHYFSYPVMAMLGMMLLPDCTSGYVDFDLLYISEIDPLWNNDLLTLLLNPEAVIFSTPAAYAWCAADCVMTTADDQKEAFYGCAGCDGSLYPFTGNIYPQPDPVAGTSLITQRVLASLHRKGLATRTIGDDAMCEPAYHPTVPKSQYKFSMMAPVAEASSSAAKSIAKPFIGDPDKPADQAANDPATNAGKAGADVQEFNDCCHPMGMSTARWCTPVGGRTRPGKDTAYTYLVWEYRNCCVRSM
jgi:conjugal transfer pilus assembly protein TraU